jgi:hypothetical protein
LAVVMVGYAGWSALYVRQGWAGRLTPLVACLDVAVAACLFVPFTELMPPQASQARLNWVVLAASPAAVCVSACGRPWLGPPAGLVLGTCLVAASRTAGAPGGGTAQALIVVAQSVVSAVVFTIVGRAGDGARIAFAALRAAEREAEIRRAERAADLTQLRLLHNGALTTLTMAVHSTDRRPSPLLRRRADADLKDLPNLGPPQVPPAEAGALVRLDVRIEQVVDACGPRLRVRCAADPAQVPSDVADAVAAAVAEARERRAARPSG